jgi:hypothetical protein
MKMKVTTLSRPRNRNAKRNSTVIRPAENDSK